jgi:hypothetical protein
MDMLDMTAGNVGTSETFSKLISASQDEVWIIDYASALLHKSKKNKTKRHRSNTKQQHHHHKYARTAYHSRICLARDADGVSSTVVGEVDLGSCQDLWGSGPMIATSSAPKGYDYDNAFNDDTDDTAQNFSWQPCSQSFRGALDETSSFLSNHSHSSNTSSSIRAVLSREKKYNATIKH